MSTSREPNQSVPSVLARLMGLADVTPQQLPVSKKPRVLSDNYLRRVSYVGVREKCSDHRSFQWRIEDQNECKNVFQVLETLRRNKRHVSGNVKINETNDNSLLSGHAAAFKSPCTSDRRDVSICRKLRRKSEQGHVSSQNKLQNVHGIYSSRELCFDDMNKYCTSNLNLNNRSSLTTRNIAPRPNMGKTDVASRCFSLSLQSHGASHSGNGKKNVLSTSWNGNVHVEMKGRKCVRNGVQSVRPRFRFLRERTKNAGSGTMEPHSETSGNGSFEKKLRSRIPSSPILYDRNSRTDRSYMAREGKKQISERWKTAKRFQHIGLANRSKTMGEMLSFPDKPAKFNPSNKGGSDIGDMNFGIFLGTSNWDGRKDKGTRDLPRSRSLCQNNDAQDCSKDSSYRNSRVIPYMDSENNLPVRDDYAIRDEQGENLKKMDSFNQISHICNFPGPNKQILQDTWNKNEGSEEDFSEHIPVAPRCSKDISFSFSCQEHQSESRDWMLLADKKEPFDIQDASSQQEIFNELLEGESTSSQYSGTDPESSQSSEEAYQPSPNSVLERIYREEISPICDCFKSVNTSLHGLHAQLELLKSDALETYSEVSSMMVSGDEDTDAGSVNDYEEKVEIMRSFRVEESRDFSYLVDVLAEAGFQNINLHPNFDAWNSEECPISYSVFETLEKKYGAQLSWKKSERKLLFDRINSGLVEILQQSMGVLTWTKPATRRLTCSQGHEMIEEELWMLLVNQEKEARKESEKFFGKDDGWLELDEDIQIIGREIESSLIEELVGDVSMEGF